MKVYLIRHGIAVPRSAPGVADDASRDLTNEGIDKLKQQAKGLAKLKVGFDRIWTSPLVRARHTAAVLAAELGMSRKPMVLPALAPGGDTQVALEQLASHQQLSEVALVGHDPGLSELAALLLSGLRTSFLQLKKGGAACIEIDDFSPPIRGELVWLLTPKLLRALA